MARLRYNGLTATLGADLLTADTTITFTAALTSAAGAVPTIGAGDYIPLVIEGATVEIVHLTAYTSGATTGTVTRAQEGTTAVDHASGVNVENGPTVADFSVASGVTATRDVVTANTVINSTTFTALTGLSRSVTSGGTSDVFLVIASLDVEMTTTSTAYFTAKLDVGGTYQTSEIVFRFDGLERIPAGQTWLVTGLAAGAHTFVMRAALTSASGAYTVNSNHSSMTILKL